MDRANTKNTLRTIKQATCHGMTESHVYYRAHSTPQVPSSGLSEDSLHL